MDHISRLCFATWYAMPRIFPFLLHSSPSSNIRDKGSSASTDSWDPLFLEYLNIDALYSEGDFFDVPDSAQPKLSLFLNDTLQNAVIAQQVIRKLEAMVDRKNTRLNFSHI